MAEQITFIGLFLMIFILVLVGTSLITPVAQQVGTASADSNMDDASSTIISLSTLFFILLVVGSVVGLVIFALRMVGM